MAKYHFTAETPEGFTTAGELMAATHDAALEFLRERRLTVRKLEVAASAQSMRLSSEDLGFFNQQLAELADARLPMSDALRELARDMKSGRLARVCAELADDLSAGKELHDAVAARRGAFPPLYAQMIETGVASGDLPGVLGALARHESIVQRVRRAVVEAVSYPVAVLAWAAVVLVIVGDIVLPQMKALVEEDNGTWLTGRSWLTGGLYWVLAHSGWTLLAALAAGLVGFLVLSRLRSGGASVWSRLGCGTPLVRGVYRDAARAQLCDTVAMALGSGKDIGAAMGLAGQALPANPLRPEVLAVAEHYRQGHLPDEATASLRHLPRLLLWSIEVAGPRGDLVATCRRLATMYAERAESTARFVRLIVAPLAIMLTGVFVFGAMAAVYLPILQLIRTLTSGEM